MAVLRNREGRLVHVLGEMVDWYVDVQDYTRVPHYVAGENGDPAWVAVIREAGGLGDVICVQAVTARLQEQGYKVRLFTPKVYWPICIADDLVDTTEAFPDPSPETWHRHTYRMFCPASDHEAAHGMRPTEGRIRNFCEAASVEPMCPPIHTVVGEPWKWDDGRKHIGLQAISANRPKDLPPVQVGNITHALRKRGYVVHAFHNRPLPEQWYGDCVHEIDQPLDVVARKLLACSAVLSVDSGILHLAGTLGVPTVGVFGPTSGPLTCEFYPSVTVVQTTQPKSDYGRGVCHTPCYYSERTNKFHCQRKISACIKSVDWRDLLSEVIWRANGAHPLHRIPDRWLQLNPPMEKPNATEKPTAT